MATDATKLRCPACGATEVLWDKAAFVFVCQFCTTICTPEDSGNAVVNATMCQVKALRGWHPSPGMRPVGTADTGVTSVRCPACGATMCVSLETNVGGLQCHWCQHHLAITDVVTGGVRPDGIIPFTVTQQQAHTAIAAFMKTRRFFAHPKFREAFCLDKVHPVYLPYVIVDSSNYADYSGRGVDNVREYTVGSGKSKETKYDYDVYHWRRIFTFGANNLMVEAADRYLVRPGEKAHTNSRNIINSIQPFDVKQTQEFDPRFLNGDFRAEFRDLNYTDIDPTVQCRIDDIGQEANEALLERFHEHEYDHEHRSLIGASAASVLAPVWLYSFRDAKGRLHFVACNGQTGETAASVPLNRWRLFWVTAAVQAVALPLGWWIMSGAMHLWSL